MANLQNIKADAEQALKRAEQREFLSSMRVNMAGKLAVAQTTEGYKAEQLAAAGDNMLNKPHGHPQVYMNITRALKDAIDSEGENHIASAHATINTQSLFSVASAGANQADNSEQTDHVNLSSK